MKNKNWDVEKIVKKWKPVIEIFDFNNEDIVKVCEYAEAHSMIESAEHLSFMNNGYPTLGDKLNKFRIKSENTLLPLSLKILQKISDLSKIHLTFQPVFIIERDGESQAVTVKTYNIEAGITPSEIMENALAGIDNIEMAENLMAEELANKMNTEISKGYELYVYLVAQSIRIITIGTEPPKIMMCTRYHIEKPSNSGDNESKHVSISDL